jgi:hypothetical protein
MPPVSHKNFEQVLEKLEAACRLGVNVEATGLRPDKEDRLFSLQLATNTDCFTFNFHSYRGIDENLILAPFHMMFLQRVLGREARWVWYFYDAPLELAFLRKEGFSPEGLLYDTKVMTRLVYGEEKKIPKKYYSTRTPFEILIREAEREALLTLKRGIFLTDKILGIADTDKTILTKIWEERVKLEQKTGNSFQRKDQAAS